MSKKAGSGGAQLRELLAATVVEAGTKVPDIEVTDITATSSRVTPGAMFIACRGSRHHGLEFASEAIAAGAAAIVWEPESGCDLPELPSSVPAVAVPGLSGKVGDLADRFFAQPSAQMEVAGITGTNGKTTTAWLVSQALAKLGATAGYMGTMGYGIGAELSPAELTTPGVITVHRRMRELADKGATHVAMEVSSHGLDQGRIDAVSIDIAAFTNLSRDHLDYHGSLEAYAAAKSRLFQVESLQSAVINIGDAFGRVLAAECPANVRLIRAALSQAVPAGVEPELVAEVASSARGITLQINGEFGEAELPSSLWGLFNAENLLVAAGILLAQGFPLVRVVEALAECTAPAGRMEVIRTNDVLPLVVVDFAHTPDALAKAIEVVRQHVSGAVTVVFGCGGERDKGKRGEMGSAASRLANRVIVTDDNPRYEDPQAIITEIVAGVDDASTMHVERDRATAIRRAIEEAGPGDAILIAGKGSESVQWVADEALPFSDAAVAADVLRGMS